MLHSVQNVIDAFVASPLIMSSATVILLLMAYIRHIFQEHHRPRLNRVTGRPKGEPPLPQGSSGREWKGWADETSKENSYYFAHGQTGKDGLTQEDYQMNGPKLLATQHSPAAGASPAKAPAAAALAGGRVTTYSFADSSREVEVLLALEGWDWTQVAADEVTVSFTADSLTVNVRSAAFGARHLHVPRLFADISAAAVAKRSAKRLTLKLTKKSAAPWAALAKAKSA